jgi:hypothetical protein
MAQQQVRTTPHPPACLPLARGQEIPAQNGNWGKIRCQRRQQKPVSHAGGPWFDPTCAHGRKALQTRGFLVEQQLASIPVCSGWKWVWKPLFSALTHFRRRDRPCRRGWHRPSSGLPALVAGGSRRYAVQHPIIGQVPAVPSIEMRRVSRVVLPLLVAVLVSCTCVGTSLAANNEQSCNRVTASASAAKRGPCPAIEIDVPESLRLLPPGGAVGTLIGFDPKSDSAEFAISCGWDTRTQRKIDPACGVYA